MTKEELNFIKDAFSQIIDDIAGNPEWGDAARAVASDLGTLERKLEKRVTELPSNLDEAADTFAHSGDVNGVGGEDYEDDLRITFKGGAEWMAGQGETRIVRANADLDPHGADYGIRYLNIRVEDDIPVGTKFIVQIRKNQ